MWILWISIYFDNIEKKKALFFPNYSELRVRFLYVLLFIVSRGSQSNRANGPDPCFNRTRKREAGIKPPSVSDRQDRCNSGSSFLNQIWQAFIKC